MPETTGEAMRGYLQRYTDGLIGAVGPVRRDEPDAIHTMRVAARRLRSTLASYGPLLPSKPRHLRDELKWLGHVLAVPRDAEVMRDHLADAIAALPPERVDGPIATRIATALGRAYADGHEATIAAIDSPRFARLVDDLEVAAAAPLRPGVDTADALAARIDAARRRFARDLAAVPPPSPGATPGALDEARDHALHAARKKAKRLRYLAESAVPVLGARAASLAVAAEEVQEALGEHQDSVVTRAWLTGARERAVDAEEPTSTYDELISRETERAAVAETEGLDHARKITDP